MDLLLIVVPLILVYLSQWYIQSSYNKYNRYKVNSKMTGYDTARMILDNNGLSNVKIEEIPGELTDHFDPTNNIVSLSSDIYNDSSIASVAVAAHECGLNWVM